MCQAVWVTKEGDAVNNEGTANAGKESNAGSEGHSEG